MISAKHIMLVLLGSGTGGVLRYVIGQLLQQKIAGKLPYGTFMVNILGSILIGILVASIAKQTEASTTIKLLLVTGFCGGFTTFSAFAFENVELIRAGNYATAIAYVLLSVALSIAGTFAGIMMIKQ